MKETKKELKSLSFIANKLLSKKNLLKINNIKDNHQRKTLLEHSIKRQLELRVLDFRNKLKKLDKEKKETFFIKIKVNLLKLKISYFLIEFHKKEFKKIMKLIKSIEKEIKNV
ncbi:hypothetical protein K9L16_01435 [Candidatus Pacearchaeota archaeon]|nr:hypothetical protein [Candidatus Pacearchaeota archaeon]